MKVPANWPSAGTVDVPVANVINADNVVASLAYPWKSVTHADSPFTPSLTQTKLSVDATGGPVTINAIVLPPESYLTVKMNTTSANPVVVNAHAGWTIEDPSTPGSFGASGTIPPQGTNVRWQFDGTTSRMIIQS